MQDLLHAGATKNNDKARARNAAAGAKHGTYDQLLGPDRRLVICVRTRSGIPGVGARRTR